MLTERQRESLVKGLEQAVRVAGEWLESGSYGEALDYVFEAIALIDILDDLTLEDALLQRVRAANYETTVIRGKLFKALPHNEAYLGCALRYVFLAARELDEGRYWEAASWLCSAHRLVQYLRPPYTSRDEERLEALKVLYPWIKRRVEDFARLAPDRLPQEAL